MDDYISREAALAHIKDKQCKDCSDIGLCGNCAVRIALKLLENVPAADVRPVVHGAWVPSERIKGYDVCSACHNCYIDSDWKGIKWKFCPNCGADMREEAEDDQTDTD